jgi:aminomethyltransferase
MRRSPIRELLAERGASFVDRNGREIACCFSDFEQEYAAVRDAVGLTDFSFTNRFRVAEEGLDVFDRYATGSVANIRFGRILHTMAVDADGYLESELYVANDDEQMILIAESLVIDEAVVSAIGEADPAAGLENISETTVLFGLDGFNAWAVAKTLFGPDVLGLPYMSIETYELNGADVKVLRAGKTSEFGYMFLTEAENGVGVWTAIEEAGAPFGLKPIGFDTHMALRLDGRFFNIHEEGAVVRDPLLLGLQWMVDIEGDDFRGRDPLMARREKGLTHKTIGVVTDGPKDALSPGDQILHGDEVVAEVVTSALSPTLNTRIGLALFGIEYAYAGLTFNKRDGSRIHTVSMPPFTAKSLTIRLDEM